MKPMVRHVSSASARLAAALLAATFAMFIWPTRFHYDRMQLLGETAPGAVLPVRIDRFTGSAEILMPEMLNDSRHNMRLGWVGLTGEPLPTDVLSELKKSVLVDVDPLPYAQIFNMTGWRITKLRWSVTGPLGTDGGRPAPRRFDQGVFIEPNTVARLYLELGRFGHGAAIAFDMAWGVPVPDDRDAR